MILDSLVLEVTRRCNMRCDHCLRGEAQNMDMTERVVRRSLKGVRRISHVTFTGGEPTLNVPIIRYFMRQLKSRNIELGSFYIATNGLEPSKRIIHMLVDLYAMCDYQEDCVVAWSNDKFHDASEPYLYQALKFYAPRYDKEHLQYYNERNLIKEGRAEEYCLSQHEHTLESMNAWEDDDGELQVDSTVYIAANGNVMTDCDCSFEKIDRLAIGNVLTDDLETVLRAAYVGQEGEEAFQR